MWRMLAGRLPLIRPGVRTSPHRNLAVAVRLPCKPFDDVAPVRSLPHDLKLALRVASASRINNEENVTVLGEVHSPVVIGVRNIRCQCKDTRQRLTLFVWTVDRCVEVHTLW